MPSASRTHWRSNGGGGKSGAPGIRAPARDRCPSREKTPSAKTRPRALRLHARARPGAGRARELRPVPAPGGRAQRRPHGAPHHHLDPRPVRRRGAARTQARDDQAHPARSAALRRGADAAEPVRIRGGAGQGGDRSIDRSAGSTRPSRRARVIAHQLQALRWIEDLVVQDPRPGDSLSAWLYPSLAARLERAGTPTLLALVERINGIGAR